MKRTYIPSFKWLILTVLALIVAIRTEVLWWKYALIESVVSLFNGSIAVTIGPIWPFILILNIIMVAMIPVFIWAIGSCWLFYCRPVRISGSKVKLGLLARRVVNKSEISMIGIAPVNEPRNLPADRIPKGIFVACGDYNPEELQKYGIFNVWKMYTYAGLSPDLAKKVFRFEAKLKSLPVMEIHPPEKIFWLSYSDKHYRELTSWWKS